MDETSINPEIKEGIIIPSKAVKDIPIAISTKYLRGNHSKIFFI